MAEAKKGGSRLHAESRGSKFVLFEDPSINININPPSNPEHPQLHHSNNMLPAGEKDAMTRDLLSLCGKNAPGEQVAKAQGPASYIMAQDISHLTEKGKAMATTLPHVSVPAAVPVNELSFRAGSADNYALVKGASQSALPSNIIFHMGGSENGNINGTKGRLGNPISYWPGVQLNFGAAGLHSSLKSTQSQSQYQMDLEPHYPSTLSKKCQRVSPEYVDMGKRPSTQVQSEEDDEDDEGSPQQSSDQKRDITLSEGDPSQRLDGRVHDVKGFSLRSKHSATEQRRRTRINERFQMLRQLVPNYDQKRDKASFLLEVIEYIQNLQEKVRKYESMEHSGRQDRMGNMPWVLGQRSNGLREVTTNSNLVNSNPALLRKECSHGKEVVVSSASTLPFHLKDDDNRTLQSRMKNASTQIRDLEVSMDQSVHHLHHDYESKYHALTKPSMPLLSSSSQSLSEVANKMNSSLLCVSRATSELAAPSSIKSGARSDLESVAMAELNRRINDPRQSESGFEEAPQASITGLKPLREIQLSGVSMKSNGDTTSANGIMPKDSETHDGEALSINGGGVINVSSAYSQGLLNTLAHAIQISGLDLSKASISVQVDLGKDGISTASTSSLKVEALQQSPCHRQNFRASLEPEIPAKRQKVEG